ncbi:efflux pump [Trichophyton mentagrophytes]|nr:efflux pump [Trichophyton mentagrophytes]
MADANTMEGEKSIPTKIPHWRQVTDPGAVTPEIINYPYPGSGTEADPYLIQWIPNDPRNPMNYSAIKKWSITFVVAIATLAVALISSAYTGGAIEIAQEFHADAEVITLGVSLFVLGFAIGPLIWAPMSELFGRQLLFFGTYLALTAFNAGAAGSPNMATLLVLRFFAGSFGSSPLTNAGGVIADMFPASHRGLAMGIFAIAPFLGPVLGPVIGGFLGESAGWRWVEGFLAIFSGVVWIIGSIFLPETYPPVLLRKRAQRLSKLTGKVYASRMDVEQGKLSIGQAFKTALMRPWILLFREPIVLLLSTYMAIVYGTLYMLFSAFPVVYQQHRGWSPGIGGLAFLGVLGGILAAMVISLLDNKRYAKVSKKYNGFAPPEERLPVAIIGGIAIPIGLFWFAWTNGPQIHWIVSIIASAPFGFGMVLVFLSLMNYLIDAYTIYAASVLAANSVLRSLFGAAFPLFTRYMYQNLGIHWASTIPAFLALACVPFPFLFYIYGANIRKRCKFAGEADAFMQKLMQANSAHLESDLEVSEAGPIPRRNSLETREVLDRIQSARSGLTRTRTAATVEYEGNPYDIDRVNTGPSRVSTTNSHRR